MADIVLWPTSITQETGELALTSKWNDTTKVLDLGALSSLIVNNGRVLSSSQQAAISTGDFFK